MIFVKWNKQLMVALMKLEGSRLTTDLSNDSDGSQTGSFHSLRFHMESSLNVLKYFKVHRKVYNFRFQGHKHFNNF